MHHASHPAVAIILPCFNEGESLRIQLKKCLSFLGRTSVEERVRFLLVVVDDGSLKELSGSVRGLSVQTGALEAQVSTHFLRHLINLGQGAALRTGITYALNKLGADFFVTMDSDGQHRLEDLMTVLRPVLENQVDIVFGNRFQGRISENMPSSRKLILQGATLFERVITGLPLGDAHNGYRAFNRLVATDLKIRQNRMAHATEIKQIVAKKRHRYSEVPVSIDYSEGSLAKGQSNMGSFAILKDLLKAYLFSG
jgi:glycosyltransferase involved in cell wall biosynthesis